ncbi:MAG: DUF885 domain-containing protein [Acidimicrobiia bacterium]|nr:DUF885 domain-containing protein [Acidimicrobiia bacterium]MDH3462997.1 DUF885 domain-containing protein [Acidimicrobiia bacterium]
MPTPFEISDRLTEQYADLSPELATSYGIAGRDHLWGDMSPERHQAQADLAADAVRELSEHFDHPDPKQAVAAKVVAAYMQELVDAFDHGDHLRDLNHIHSPTQVVRDVFDLMPTDTDEGRANIVSRLSTVDQPLAGYRQTLQLGLDRGEVVARRQVESVIGQCRSVAAETSRFEKYRDMAEAGSRDPAQISRAIEHAKGAFGELAEWLERVYLPRSAESDSVGRERYLQATEKFLGIGIDPLETYEWGWGELFGLRQAMIETAREIDPKLSVVEVIHLLDTDPGRSAPSHGAFADFVQGIQNEAVEQLAGTHFDVPEDLKRVTVNIAPGDGALGAWYHGPSEDMSRPGSIWYAPGSRVAIPVWQEVSTAYHEGFPGHHLQVGTATMLKDRVSRFHRVFLWKSGAGEGWALYAERLMDELGFFTKPEYRLGLLASQLFRATRVVVDIGSQLQLTIPESAPLHPGERWNYDIAVDYMEKIGLQERDVAESEVKRYLGWYGQAISYKLGERELLKIREERRQRDGDGFDLKAFHREALEVGAIRLDQVREFLL